MTSEEQTRYEETKYGFRFGALLVERAASLGDGRVCIGITTDTGQLLHVYASKTGRSLRVFTPGAGEWRRVTP